MLGNGYDVAAMRYRRFVIRLSVSLVAILLSLVLLEIALRAFDAAGSYFAPDAQESRSVPLHIINDSPVLYRLNPAHPDISSQGLRDDEAAIPKPEGVRRILVLGDSVAYGNSVPRADTFPNRLERLLRQQFGPVEVINAGVMGYTPYNELQYYLHEGKNFGADLVIVAFCMNDVVNPRLHWIDAPGVKIPPEAIPNAVYDRDHVLPRIRQLEEEEARRKSSETVGLRLLRHSRLYVTLARVVERLVRPEPKTSADTKKIPTYVTGEDTLSIEVLLDRTSPEWRWLGSMYDRLHEAVRAERATLVIVVFPLAYQLDVGYPFLPQDRILDYCREESIPCLDLLPSFRRHRKEDVFILDKEGRDDIWHLTDYGHELSANEIQKFLQEKELLSVNKQVVNTRTKDPK